MNAISAAHPTLPMPCYVRVTNLANQRSLIVRINDRGPYHGNREIDLSGKAAQLLGFADRGIARVRVEYVGAAPMEGSDDGRLMATLRQGEPAPAPAGVMLASAKPFVPDFAERGRSCAAPFRCRRIARSISASVRACRTRRRRRPASRGRRAAHPVGAAPAEARR